jgi:hypothetical protein
MERKTRLSICVAGVVVATLDIDYRAICIIEMEIARQLIRAWSANVPAVIGALFGSEELDGHRITVESVAQTFPFATLKRTMQDIVFFGL